MLTPTEIYGEITALLINENREHSLESHAVDEIDVTYEGFEGEAHGGLTRPSCSRVLRQYGTRGTEIRNARQISILSTEELDEIAKALDIPVVRPEWVGANLVLRGIPQLSQLPPSSRLIFEGGASVVIDIENGPCRFPGDVIEQHHPGKGRAFPKAARGLRGVVGWVEKTGKLRNGERARLHIPPQRIYAPAT